MYKTFLLNLVTSKGIESYYVPLCARTNQVVTIYRYEFSLIIASYFTVPFSMISKIINKTKFFYIIKKESFDLLKKTWLEVNVQLIVNLNFVL